MSIKPASGISADGFEVQIDENENIIFKESYRYVYDASYNEQWEKLSGKPFTTNILLELVSKYGVTNICVTAGVFTFSQKPMIDADVQKFINAYIKPNARLYEITMK